MGQILGMTLLIYVILAATLTPIFVVAGAMAARDCRLLSGEQCVWVIVPVSGAPEDQRPTP